MAVVEGGGEESPPDMVVLVMCSSTGGRLTPSVSDCTKKNVRVGP